MNLVNKTPHDINIVPTGQVLSPVLPTPRVAQTTIQVGDIGSIPLTRKMFGDLQDLPDPIPGTLFIVNALTALAAKDLGRDDFIVPNAVRDADNKIVGCDGFSFI